VARRAQFAYALYESHHSAFGPKGVQWKGMSKIAGVPTHQI
jgi:hypothetical protein